MYIIRNVGVYYEFELQIKFEKYLKENNLEDKNNLLELFSQLTLEQLAEKTSNF